MARGEPGSPKSEIAEGIALDALEIINRRVGDVATLVREREQLPRILRVGERLVDVEAASLSSFLGRPGLVGLTTERLMHLSFRP